MLRWKVLFIFHFQHVSERFFFRKRASTLRHLSQTPLVAILVSVSWALAFSFYKRFPSLSTVKEKSLLITLFKFWPCRRTWTVGKYAKRIEHSVLFWCLSIGFFFSYKKDSFSILILHIKDLHKTTSTEPIGFLSLGKVGWCETPSCSLFQGPSSCVFKLITYTLSHFLPRFVF